MSDLPQHYEWQIFISNLWSQTRRVRPQAEDVKRSGWAILQAETGLAHAGVAPSLNQDHTRSGLPAVPVASKEFNQDLYSVTKKYQYDL